MHARLVGGNQEAAYHYEAAMPLRDPRTDGAAYVGLGAALHAQRKIREALKVLEAGAKLNPTSGGMLENLATVGGVYVDRTAINKVGGQGYEYAITFTPGDGGTEAHLMNFGDLPTIVATTAEPERVTARH